mmetsp:Transcript_71877/g.166321  ORF Transcript_71877/g.166321 Transcript_71877/m.166321 type:complete len:245 (-) Transcript_71877:502-1236(-)
MSPTSKCRSAPCAFLQSTSPSTGLGSGSLNAPESSSWSVSAKSFGTARSDVPVSTTARHWPSSQKSRVLLPRRSLVMCTCQYPSSGKATGAQLRPERTSSGEWPPKEISLVSSSLSAKKTPKLGCSKCLCAVIMPKKLNSGASAKPSKPRPRTPSKAKAWKGSCVISVAVTSRISTQLARSSSSAVSLLFSETTGTSAPPKSSLPSPSEPKQSRSFTNWPVTSPVPKATVIWSRGAPGATGVPS